jgi:hypothetical protein
VFFLKVFFFYTLSLSLSHAQTLQPYLSTSHPPAHPPLTQCTEDHISAESSIKSSLAYCDVEDAFLADLPWFEHNFPEDLPMKQVLEVYRTLEVAAQAPPRASASASSAAFSTAQAAQKSGGAEKVPLPASATMKKL